MRAVIYWLLRALDRTRDRGDWLIAHIRRRLAPGRRDEESSRVDGTVVRTGAGKRSLELSVDLDSLAAWTAFRKATLEDLDPAIFDGLGRAILRRGCVEPLSRTRIKPWRLVKGNSWREGLLYNGINSRGRGVMHVIEGFLKADGVHSPRIYAAEGVTAFAMRLRGLYPRFLGSEFTLDREQRDLLYPIPCEDLQNLSLRSDSFDIVSTNEVLEHVPSIDKALAEIHRVLRPGGWHVGTMPFHYCDPASTRRALMDEGGEIIHLLEPEYHGDPMNDGGVLVFEIPGWDIIARARHAGFSSAFMRFLISTRHGVLSEQIGGVFILCCQK
jgi:hypothetical protein